MIKIIQKQGLAFVCFIARESAIKAVETLHERFFINEKRLKVLWAKSQLEMPTAQHKKHQFAPKNPEAKQI